MQEKIDFQGKSNMEREDEVMSTSALQYRRLDFDKISKRIVGKMSSEEALAEITPVQWPEDVVNGKKKVIISQEEKSE